MKQSKAIAFDVDRASLRSLREALPGWEVKSVRGANAAALAQDSNPGSVDLHVVGFRGIGGETLRLCRFLALGTPFETDSRQQGAEVRSLGENGATGLDGRPNGALYSVAPLLVLVPPGQETFVAAALEAGAHSCLVLPIYAQDVASMLVHARAGNEPGRHTLNLEQAQSEDRWRDDGGQG